MKTLRPARPRSAAFTMVEILVVISIIALLASLSMVAMGHANRTSKREKTKAYIKAIELKLESFKNDNGTYPRPKEGSEGTTTTVSGNNYSVGGAIALYQALTADGDDGLEGGDTGSMGKPGTLPEATVYWADADPNGGQKISRPADGKWFIADGFGVPFQYLVPPPVDPRNPDNFEALRVKYKNPRSYDLWSYGGIDDANFADEKTWLKNW